MTIQSLHAPSHRPRQILESVYVTEQAFDGMTVRGVVVTGSRCTLVFDTLVFPHYTKELLSVCSNYQLIVVYSHADWDHVWGTCGLPESEVVAHEECARRFADQRDVQHTLDEYVRNNETALAGIALVSPNRTFRTELTLDLGDLTVELRYCPGHTKDSIVALVPERSLLLAGDCLETPLPLLNEDASNLGVWIETLAELEQDSTIATCVPSHGPIGNRELIANNIAYLKSLLNPETLPPPGLDAFYSTAHEENRRKTAPLRTIRPEPDEPR